MGVQTLIRCSSGPDGPTQTHTNLMSLKFESLAWTTSQNCTHISNCLPDIPTWMSKGWKPNASSFSTLTSPSCLSSHFMMTFSSRPVLKLWNNPQLHSSSSSSFFFLNFWLHFMACRILVSRPGIEPVPLEVEATGPPGKSQLYFLKIIFILSIVKEYKWLSLLSFISVLLKQLGFTDVFVLLCSAVFP